MYFYAHIHRESVCVCQHFNHFPMHTYVRALLSERLQPNYLTECALDLISARDKQRPHTNIKKVTHLNLQARQVIGNKPKKLCVCVCVCIYIYIYIYIGTPSRPSRRARGRGSKQNRRRNMSPKTM